jgi:putative Holliday junction resolvase
MNDAVSDKKRVLAIDPGTKRTGFAVSDEIGVTAQGLETYEGESTEKLADHIAGLVERYDVGVVVVGMPLSMSGGEIEGTVRSKDLANMIEDRCGVEVVMRDERMTSLEVEKLMRREGKIKKAGDIDRLSAVLLLQDYLGGGGA